MDGPFEMSNDIPTKQMNERTNGITIHAMKNGFIAIIFLIRSDEQVYPVRLCDFFLRIIATVAMLYGIVWPDLYGSLAKLIA